MTTVATITPWKPGAAPAAWAAGRIYFIRRRVTNGVFDGWSALPDGTDEVCHTDIPAYPSTTHAGISDVTPDGKYALVTVERSGHWPYADGDQMGSPGRGTYNDLWLHELATGRAWKVRDILKQKTNALIWPRFDATGTRVVWSELVVPAIWPGVIGGLGQWRMHVATITWTAGVPSLTDVKTKLTTGLMEAYGFSPDGTRVLFAADKLLGLEFDATAIADMPADLSGTARRLSPATPVGWWANYNEFAFYIPGTDRMIFARIFGGTQGSLEYWTANRDGTDPAQLTWCSTPGNPQFHGTPSLAGGLAFDPANPLRFAAGFAGDYTDGYISALIDLAV